MFLLNLPRTLLPKQLHLQYVVMNMNMFRTPIKRLKPAMVRFFLPPYRYTPPFVLNVEKLMSLVEQPEHRLNMATKIILIKKVLKIYRAAFFVA
jgi:hypothetical protein